MTQLKDTLPAPVISLLCHLTFFAHYAKVAKKKDIKLFSPLLLGNYLT